MKSHGGNLSLNTYLNHDFIRLVTAFSEESAKAFGLKHDETISLTLACEEVFVYLCGAGQDAEAVVVEAINGTYYVQVKFLFKHPSFNPRAFNLTANVSWEDGACLDEMGLLIASRTVDRFHIAGSPQQGLELVLTKEKAYPTFTDTKIPAINQMSAFQIAMPDMDNIKLFSRLVVQHYPKRFCAPFFSQPGKVADMVLSGDCGAALAFGDEGQIGGGIFWQWVSKKTVESFGPYLFNQPEGREIAIALLDSCLERIAKTEAIGLIHRYATAELPTGYFESLGTVNFHAQDDKKSQPLYYRQLSEDLGCPVWATPDLEQFLKSEYQRLFLPRNMRLTRHEGEQRPAYSVFAPRFDRSNGQITLRPIWDGIDVSANLARHVHVCREENLTNIFFEIDLAFAWQAKLTEALLENHFYPRLILPYGGEADIVVFQNQEGS